MSAKLKWRDAKGVREGVELTERFCLTMMRYAHKAALRSLALYRSGSGPWAEEEYRRHHAERKVWMAVIRASRQYTRVDVKHVVGERVSERDRLWLKAHAEKAA